MYSSLLLKEFIPVTSMVNLDNRVNSQGGVHRIKNENIIKQILPKLFGSYYFIFIKICLPPAFLLSPAKFLLNPGPVGQCLFAC